MDKEIKMTKEHLVNLLDVAYRKGYEQALQILQGLQATSGMSEEEKKKLIEML